MKDWVKNISCLEVFKTIILTAWLIFSVWLMWKVYKNPILSHGEDFWSNIIAIVGIIIATLIGWQIYSAMDWNSKIEKLNKIESLESDLKTTCIKLYEQDKRNLTLIRAVNEIRKSSTLSGDSVKYRCAAKAISLLIDANVPIEDDLIDIQIDILNELLGKMEQTIDAKSKRLCAISLSNMDKYYNDIMASINKKEIDLSDFRDKIIAIRDRRKKFVEDNQ